MGKGIIMDYLVKITHRDNGTCVYLHMLHAAQVCMTDILGEATRMDQETAERWVHWLNRSESPLYVISAVKEEN